MEPRQRRQDHRQSAAICRESEVAWILPLLSIQVEKESGNAAVDGAMFHCSQIDATLQGGAEQLEEGIGPSQEVLAATEHGKQRTLGNHAFCFGDSGD